MLKASIIFPARNEEMLIEKVVLDVYGHLKLKKYSFEILVIANGCTDNTENIVNKIGKKHKEVKLVLSNPGYGYALRKGLEESKGEYIVIFNVDFYDLHLIDLIDIDLYGKDFIIGSKRAHWSVDKRNISRRIISSLFNNYLKIFHNFRGSDTHGIKVLKREVLNKVYDKCQTTSGIFDTELVILAQYEGAKIADFPVCVEEVRPPRFVARVLQTPLDILNLDKSLGDYKRKKDKNKKELFYDEISDTWSSKINNLETQKRIKVVYNQLLKGISINNKKFLEVGCGLGYFSKEAIRKGAKVTGLDIGKKLVKVCKKSIPKGEFVVGTATKLPFKDDSFDLVLSTEVIEHTALPQKAITELIRVTKNGGYLVITTPNKIWKPFFDILSKIRIRMYQGNENWLYPWELKNFLVENGVKIVREKYFNIIAPNKYLDKLEDYGISKFISINQSYLVQKITMK